MDKKTLIIDILEEFNGKDIISMASKKIQEKIKLHEQIEWMQMDGILKDLKVNEDWMNNAIRNIKITKEELKK